MILRYLGLLLVGIIFGLFGVMIHWNALMFGDLAQVALRNGIALIALQPIIYFRRVIFNFPRRVWWWLLVYVVAAALGFVFVTLAYLEAEIKTVLAVRYLTSVCLSVILARLILSETITRANVLAMLLAIGGIMIFAYPYQDFFTPGVFYALGVGVTLLILSYIVKQIAISPEALMLAEFSFITVVLGVVVWLIDAPVIITYHPGGLATIIIFGILLVVVTYLFIYGFRETNYSLANIVLTSEIGFGLIFGWLFLQQTITFLEALGIGLIFIAAILPNLMTYLGHRCPRFWFLES